MRGQKAIKTVSLGGGDFATQTTLALIKAKTDLLLNIYDAVTSIDLNKSTAAKQDTGNTSLASILAKIIAAPATEAKQDTGNTSLASILAKIIAAPATEAKQDTLIAKDFATQTTLALIKAKTDNLDLATTVLRDALRGTSNKTLTDIESVLALIKATDGIKKIVDALPEGNNNIGRIVGNMKESGAEVTRPADTIAYSANDVISNSTSAPTNIDLSATWRASWAAGFLLSGFIAKVRLMTDQKTNTARYRIHFFETGTNRNDNTPMTLLYTDKVNHLGSVDLPAMTSEDATNSTAAHTKVDDLRLPFVLPDAVSNIGVIIEVLDAFTPASAQKFYLEITIDAN